MEDESAIYGGLSRFGLSKYEARVYVTLLLYGPQTASHVVRESGVPQPRIYDVFNSLVRKGFAESSSGRRKYFRAVPVTLSMGKYVKDMSSYVEEFEKKIDGMKAQSPEKLQYAWTIEGKNNIDEKIKSMIAEARNEIILAVETGRLKANLRAIMSAMARGVTVAVVVFSDIDSGTLSEIPRDVILRKRSGKSAEIVLIDRMFGLIDLQNRTEPVQYALLFDSDRMMHLLGYYFYFMIWITSKPEESISVLSHRTVSNIWLACEIIDAYQKKNIEADCELVGFVNNVETTLRGRIIGTEVIPGIQQTFYIDDGNRKYSVGGKTAMVEDVRLVKVKILKHSL